MKRVHKIILMLALLVLCGASKSVGSNNVIFNGVDTRAMNHWVDSVMSKLSLDERISQIIISVINPRKASDDVLALAKTQVEDYKVGGLIYNESDIVSQASVTNYAQSLAKVPLMITLDGEWGPGMRLEDAPRFARNLFIGAIDDDKVFYQYGLEVARECRRMGVHVNFAPVLDVIDRKNTVLGTRSFGYDPDAVARHGIAFARGMEDGGVLSVGKHFPGHGSTIADSHKELPTVDKSLKELNLYDFLPFKKYIDAGLSGMLTAHLYVPAINQERVPGTMSAAYVNDLLKNKMGFKGLVFTDALGMEGAKEVNGSVCVNALLAGNDVLLMPDNIPSEIQAIKQAIDNGTITQKLIDERCRKMLCFKYALGLNKPQHVDLNNIIADMNAPESQVVQRKLISSAITVVTNQNNILPIRNLNKKRIAVVTMGNENGTESAFTRRCASYAGVTPIDYRAGMDLSSIEQKLTSGNYNCVIVCVAHADPAYLTAVSRIAARCPNVVVALMSHPERLDNFGSLIGDENVKAAVVGYDKSKLVEDYLAQTIFGGNAATGSLPVPLIATNKVLPAGTGHHYDKIRLGYSVPAEVGLDNNLLAQVDSVCDLAIKQKAFPGCQVLVARHGQVVLNKAYGEIDFGSEIPVTVNTLYGLASVSKATGTLSAVMKLYDNGKFKLDELASRYIPGLRGTDKEDITFTSLLYHETGMPPSLNMWEMMMDKNTYNGKLITSTPNEWNTIKIQNGAYGHKRARLRTDILSREKNNVYNRTIADGLYGSQVTYDSIMNRIYNAKLGPKKYRYSCLNFCLLANAVENISSMPLDVFTDSLIFAPLGASHTLYLPLRRFQGSQIAYTEVDTYLRRQHIHGYVHDELAAFSGGVQGNAGLFSSANDLAKLLQMWVNGGEYGGERFYKESTVKLFTTSKSLNSHRGLGFDKPVVGNPQSSNTCDEASPQVYGHTGFTGTCFWVDPKYDIIYIFLSNRVCPTRDNSAFSRLSPRSTINSIIYKSIINN